ncbi:MAG: hypothetical protein KIS96_03725 [Bauldia sp.]|nr:hypothetical protein [Bauldia sp.]
MSKARKRAALPDVKIGDYVLIGSTSASFPGNWSTGLVLWVGKGDVLIERANQNGGTWREVDSILHVRAHGTLEHCWEAQRRAGEVVRDLIRAAHEAESALVSARDKVWNKLDEFASGLAITMPDFAAIEDERKSFGPIADQEDAEAQRRVRAAGIPTDMARVRGETSEGSGT